MLLSWLKMGWRFLSSPALFLVALIAVAASGQQVPTAPQQGWRGRWAASAGPRTFHGRWWAEISDKSKNGASGTWTLLSDRNDILLEGTWSARKSATAWKGTWTARMKAGRPFSGSWSSEVTEGETFGDILK